MHLLRGPDSSVIMYPLLQSIIEYQIILNLGYSLIDDKNNPNKHLVTILSQCNSYKKIEFDRYKIYWTNQKVYSPWEWNISVQNDVIVLLRRQLRMREGVQNGKVGNDAKQWRKQQDHY